MQNDKINIEQYREIINAIADNTDEIISSIKQNTKHILNQKIEPYLPPDKEMEIIKFTSSKYWSNSEIVNVFDVIGTAHPNYIGLTWIDILKAGIRMHINLPLLKQNPIYYFEQTTKIPDMHYTKINNKLYISGEGNHRTAIAKVLFSFTGHYLFGGVKYVAYEINFDYYKIFNELNEYFLQKRLPIQLHLIKKTEKREDTANWFKEYYSLFVKIKNLKKNKEQIINISELKNLEIEIKKASFFDKLLKRGKFGKILW